VRFSLELEIWPGQGSGREALGVAEGGEGARDLVRRFRGVLDLERVRQGVRPVVDDQPVLNTSATGLPIDLSGRRGRAPFLCSGRPQRGRGAGAAFSHAGVHLKTTVLEPSVLAVMFETVRCPLLVQ
jgi:hypothetical protein